MYYKSILSGYIIAISKDSGEMTITEAEYNHITEIIRSRPKAPEGYEYRLTESLEWELCEVPVVEDVEENEEATEADYLAALAELGVTDEVE